MKRLSGSSAIARHQVFITNDGNYVVQWDDDLVQDIYSGEYLEFDDRHDYGRMLNDHELKQLKNNGRVERYNRQYVWLMPLPEATRLGRQRVMGRGNRIRAFYLITRYPKTQVESVRNALNTHGYAGSFTARIREDRVVILGQHGLPFRDVQVAESAQVQLSTALPQYFDDLTMAFIELDDKSPANRVTMENETTSLNLNDIIASQSDNSSLAGKSVVLAIPQEDERAAFSELLKTMSINILEAASAAATLHLLEDHPAELLIMDIQQPDMHGWLMINKIREISHLRELPITVITDKADMGMTVAKVDYLSRPVSIARLRHSIWTALKSDPANPS